MIADLLRADTNDAEIWQQVYENNEYQIGDLSDQKVLDCGAHVGSFARKCFDAGALHVYCVEPCTDTARILTLMLAPERRVCHASVLLAAVAAEHGEGFLVHNLHGHSGDTLVLHLGAGEKCALVALKDLIERWRPDVVKLDVEGSEYTILDGLVFPDHVKTLWVEFHECDHFLRQFVVLLDGLHRQGFTSHLLKEYIPFPDRFPVRSMAYLYRFER